MRKYIGPVKSDNFIYPNNVLEEYDVEIIHDINNNSVSGTTSGFSAIYNPGTGNIGISFTYIWNKNGAEPFIDDNDQLHVLSVHMSDPTKQYYKPWRMISGVTTSSVSANTVTDTFLIIVTPAQMGLTSFSSGTYDFEVRFIGKKAIYPVCQTASITLPTPTPTPGPGPTPTPTPSNPCYCYEIVVTGTTGGEGGTIAVLDYNDCYGVRTSIGYTIGPGTYKQCIQTISGVVQYFEGTYGIDTSYLTIPGVGNCRTGYVCTGYTPAGTPTPTPTPTATSVGPTSTPTPTPTATSVPPTSTPTPTPTATSVGPTPTPTPTATPLPTYTYLVDCSGTLQGYCLGNLSAGQQVLIGGICYVATTTTTSPTGTLISGTQTLGTCCPTPTPTPTLPPVGIGIYTGATFGNATLACNNGSYPSSTVYIANGDTLSNGDVLYTLPNLTSPYIGNDNYYRLLTTGSSYYAATISGLGIVSNLTACSGIATPTPTPTATPTPTPTPTATSAPTSFYINIANNSTVSDITNITVNGVAISGVTFPIVAGDGGSGVSDQMGTYSVVISYTSGVKYVEITDTDSNYNCAGGTGTSRTFNGQITNGTTGIMYITMADGSSCP